MKKQYKRVVVKVGTSTLAHSTGRLNIRRVGRLVETLSDLQNEGYEIVLVSSGAIGIGAGKLGFREKPTDIPTRQACAAVGQCELMYTYDRLFGQYNHTVAQVLMTRHTVEEPQSRENAINAFSSLLSLGVIPVINENDTVAIEEVEFGDNDTLSAIVAELVEADLLILLTDIDGLYDKDPHEAEDAKLIPVVKWITDEIRMLAGRAKSKMGTGGMVTKVQAAERATALGIPTVIANGREPEILYDVLAGKSIGTVFLPGEE